MQNANAEKDQLKTQNRERGKHNPNAPKTHLWGPREQTEKSMEVVRNSRFGRDFNALDVKRALHMQKHTI